MAGSVVAMTEAGRRHDGGCGVFRARAALWAPVWLLERATCAWLALGTRLAFGGVRYRGIVLRRAATPLALLCRRFTVAGVRLDAPAKCDAAQRARLTPMSTTIPDVGADRTTDC